MAVADDDGKIILEKRKMLTVKKGARGLRQSEGFFQHVINLPELLERISDTIDIQEIGCIAVSTRPRNQEGSYMPVFTAGEKFAKTLSLTLEIPVFTTTHQDGHLMASAYGSNFNYELDHISVHLSGGTSEILKSSWRNIQDGLFKIEIIGGTLDLAAGQLIDRLGVPLGFDFPCGKAMDIAVNRSEKELYFPVSTKGTWFNLSGSELYGKKYIEAEEHASDVSKGLFLTLAKTLEKCLKSASEETGLKNILMAGGVSSSEYIQQYLRKKLKNSDMKIHFSGPEYSTDNAIGVAILGSIFRRDHFEA